MKRTRKKRVEWTLAALTKEETQKKLEQLVSSFDGEMVVLATSLDGSILRVNSQGMTYATLVGHLRLRLAQVEAEWLRKLAP